MTGLRWGLVGASDIAARSLVRAIRAIRAIRAQPASTVVAVHSRCAERGAAYARRWGIRRSYEHLDGVLADAEVDAVYVSATNDQRPAPRRDGAGGQGRQARPVREAAPQ